MLRKGKGYHLNRKSDWKRKDFAWSKLQSRGRKAGS